MLRADAVCCTIKKNPIVRDVSFTIRPGEVLALLGANGAGKSTLMRLLCGERQPDGGQLHFYDKPLSAYGIEEMAKKRATLHQHNTVNMPFTVAEIVMMGRYPHYNNNPAAQDHTTVEECTKICGVHHLLERNFLSLSGGEQQRVQLARVLSQVWDMPGSLLLLDEPVAAMDVLYQQQTLAILKALARKGYMVIAALHEINLAAQYADRILMMKNGKRWCDGTPSEVLTPLNIYTVFSIEAEVVINPRTLNPYMVPKEIKLHAALFNTTLPMDQQEISLKERYEVYRDAHPQQQPREIAVALGVSEAELLMTGLGNQVVLLRPEMEAILQAAAQLGSVKALTRNEHCIHESKGIYHDTISLALRLEKWHIALAVHDTVNSVKSLQFFNAEGTALHKILLTAASNEAAYDELVATFRHAVQEPVGLQAAGEVPAPVTNSLEGNVVRELTIHDFKALMASCSDQAIPLMLYAGNEGCVQQYNGVIKNLVGMGAWYHVNDADFMLHLREGGVAQGRHVCQSSLLGDINCVELYDEHGHPILQVFGGHTPGEQEPAAWKEALSQLG